MRKLWRILVAAVVATGLSASPAAGASPRIESRLLQEFWTYALETPVAENPFTLGTACVPLRRDVVLPFATLDGGPLTCTVTARTRVFVTVINWECSTPLWQPLVRRRQLTITDPGAGMEILRDDDEGEPVASSDRGRRPWSGG